MRIANNVYTLAVQSLVGGACKAAGVNPGSAAVDVVADLLRRHFTDHSRRLTEALEITNERAWRALEIALAGDSLWDRCKRLLTSGDNKAFREQVRPFLDACPPAELHGRTAFRQACLSELQSARKARLLEGGELEPAALARRAGTFAAFADPTGVIRAQDAALGEMAEELRSAGHDNLASFVGLRPRGGEPLLVLAARYFFRRAVEDDDALFRGLAFAQMEHLQEGQESAFARLDEALRQQAGRLDELLGDIRVTVTATQEAVLDIQEEQRRQGERDRELYRAVLDVQGRLDLMHRELRPRDSLSIRGDAERALVKQLVARYRALPHGRRAELPALLHAIGKLEVAAGDFQAAQNDFAAVAELVADPQAQAEAHAHAYLAALERRDWATALEQLSEAVRLDRGRFAPFPFEKYQPRRILGAGGFGVAFLCKHRRLNADVVVKTLLGDDLDRGVDQVFAEAQILRQLDHPAIVRVQDCDFASPDESKPYLVMDYFDGVTLEEQARGKPMSVDDLLAVARQVAAGLNAAHGKGILHRDVKPANILVRKDGPAWQVKIIDFGLAMRRTGRETMLATAETLTASSIAGTLDYAAPEQLGRLSGFAVGPCSDVYGFGRTCCYALFQTPQPLLRHWRGIPDGLAELLESCLEEKPDARPRDFGAVLDRLGALAPPAPSPTVSLPVAPPAPAAAPRPVGELTREQRLEELAALAKQVSDCTRCPVLVGSRTQTVFGAGPLDPDICFIGEGPGADEDRTGEPFVGASGQVFNELLQAVGLRREDVYITNLLKCRPPGNRTPQPTEVANCRGYLERQIELIRPRYICTLGGVASQNLLGSTLPIGRLRRKLHDYKGIPVWCTYHPAFLLAGRSPEKKSEVIEDLKQLLRFVRLPVVQE